jgi:NADPH-dependent F420 reductase
VADGVRPDPVAILGGTGPQGRGLAVRFARAGVPVVIGSRDPARAAETAASSGGEEGLALTGAGNAEAASSCETVFVSVPWEAHEPTLRSLVDELSGRIVVDLVNPLTFDGRGPRALPVPEGSAAEQAQAILPSARVVSGFHHVSARLLLDGDAPVETDILVCGDDRAAKDHVMALAELIPGTRALDAGPLRLAAQLEGLTAVILAVNQGYRANAGVRLTNVELSRRR